MKIARHILGVAVVFFLGTAFPALGQVNGVSCRDYDPNRVTLDPGSSNPDANFTLSGRIGYLEGGYLAEVIPKDQPYDLKPVPASCASSKASPYIFECELVGEQVTLTGLKDNKSYALRMLGGDLVSTFSLYEQTLQFASQISTFKRLATISLIVEGPHITGIGRRYDFGSENDDRIVGCRLVK